MEDLNLYDEFGNYIGPEIPQIEDEEPLIENEPLEDDQIVSVQRLFKKNIMYAEQLVVLNEDKQYYPEAQQVYGNNVEIMVQEEDAQPIADPIVAPIKSKQFDYQEKSIPDTTFNYEFMTAIMQNQRLIRNIALLGHLHSGKTTLMDVFVEQTHSLKNVARYTDTRMDEQARLISIKSTPMSLILPDSQDKSYLVNLYDTPGHINFSDEACSALRVSDGALLVVDAVEGVMMNTERFIKYCVSQNIPIIVFINKIDRLILEMKLPPSDAYLKIKHTLEEINGIIANENIKVSPHLGNVIFGSGFYSFMFTLKSIARIYADTYQVDKEILEKLLWGDYYFNKDTKKFMKQPNKDHFKRTFVEFVLEPLYKLCVQVVQNERDQLEPTLAKLGIYLKKSEYKLNTKELLRIVLKKYYGNTSSIVDVIVQQIPHVQEGNIQTVKKYYQGEIVDEAITTSDPKGPLMINIVKLYNKPDCMSFDAFGRVLSGTIHKNQHVKVLGETYNTEDEEDMTIKTVKKLWVYQGRYRVEIPSVPAGNWVLIEGIDQSITKTATIVDVENKWEILRPIKHNTVAAMKVAIEPLVPSELPKMLESLRKINKSYPLLHTKVEESGEHVLVGTGELYLESCLHDLRKMYAEIEIKVSDPSVRFCETVIDTSQKKCYAETPNKKNRIHMISGPLDRGLGDDIENEKILLSWDQKEIQNTFTEVYNWDILAARSVWAFGPDKNGANLLLDDTLPSETNKGLLRNVKDSVIQGFQWATREGPLCDEPIRNVKFKLIEANIANEPLHRGGGQIIPTSRRTCYSSFLMATPRIMEPMLLAEIQCSADSLDAIHNVLLRRRGHVISETAKPGTPLYTVKADIPCIDSFGFETDLRVHTQGQEGD